MNVSTANGTLEATLFTSDLSYNSTKSATITNGAGSITFLNVPVGSTVTVNAEFTEVTGAKYTGSATGYSVEITCTASKTGVSNSPVDGTAGTVRLYPDLSKVTSENMTAYIDQLAPGSTVTFGGAWNTDRLKQFSSAVKTGLGEMGNLSLDFTDSALSCSSIGDDAFEDCTAVKSVNIGDSITSIGSSAFYGCSKLDTVTIGEGVTSIGYGAFKDTNLTSIDFKKKDGWKIEKRGISTDIAALLTFRTELNPMPLSLTHLTRQLLNLLQR